MSDIDPEKLEAALGFCDATDDWAHHTQLVVAAARAHLATLPRWKEVEVEKWAVMRGNGQMVSCLVYDSEEEAIREETGSGITVFRLTGAAKIKVTL